MMNADSADVVVVGGGTVGAWTAVQLAERHAGRVVLVEAKRLGAGATSRAAGMVRAQGGTETAIRLGMRTQDFYRSTGERFPLDCGFVEQGYLIPCFSDEEVAQARARIALQRGLGLDVEWVCASDLDSRRTGLRPGLTMGAAYAPGDGYIEASRNVLAYTAALIASGVDVRERCGFTGLRSSGGRVVGVETTAGHIATDRVVLTGGPTLGRVGTLAGGFIPAGGARHQVVVTEPVPSVDVRELPMVFDLKSGIYWRPVDSGGILWGMSNPGEEPGEALRFDEEYYAKARARIETLFPAIAGLGLRRTWAATIDYTRDHTAILGPLLTSEGPVAGTVVASAAGHGMMWGPAVAEAAADLVMTGGCSWLDVSGLGLDRFDADGNSSLATDPIALPFPDSVIDRI